MEKAAQTKRKKQRHKLKKGGAPSQVAPGGGRTCGAACTAEGDADEEGEKEEDGGNVAVAAEAAGVEAGRRATVATPQTMNDTIPDPYTLPALRLPPMAFSAKSAAKLQN